MLNAPVMPEKKPPLLFWARVTERNGMRTKIAFILKMEERTILESKEASVGQN